MTRERICYVDHPFAAGTPISLHPIQIDKPFHKHAHTFYEITYISEGCGTLNLNHDSLPVGQGDLVFIPHGQEHVFLPSSRCGTMPFKTMNCLFDKQILLVPQGSVHNRIHEDFERLTQLFRENKNCIRIRERARDIARIMFRLEMEQSCKPTGFRYKLYLYVMELLNHIRKEMSPQTEVPVQSVTNPVQFAIDDMSTNCKSPVKPEEICKQSSITVRHFQRKFKEATGTTYTKMLQHIRINRSCELLLDTDWNIQSIAREAGIQDMKYFYQLFKERCGVTPQEFRINSRK